MPLTIRFTAQRCVLAALCLLVMGSCGRDQQPEQESESVDQSEPDVSEIKSLSGPVTFELEDAEARHREYPDSFWIPPREQRESLVKDDLVKLLFVISDGVNSQTERMWVLVERVEGNQYAGILDNDPYSTDQLKAGEPVTFGPQHVIDIYEVEVEGDENEDGS